FFLCIKEVYQKFRKITGTIENLSLLFWIYFFSLSGGTFVSSRLTYIKIIVTAVIVIYTQKYWVTEGGANKPIISIAVTSKSGIIIRFFDFSETYCFS